MLTAKRTLVKSGPELWAEISDPEALGSLLEPFGEIRITRVADDSLVEWEGERAAGRLELEPSGFGTRVHLMAEVGRTELPAPPAPEAPPEPRRGWFARLFRHPPEPLPEPAPPASVRVPAMDDDEALAVLTGTLDSLGMARHRPFSR
jgi:hypothetical protein